MFVALDKLLPIRTYSVNVLSLWTIFYQCFVIYHVLIRTCLCQFDHCFLVVAWDRVVRLCGHFNKLRGRFLSIHMNKTVKVVNM